ncbi:unnamed protein product [marine sediment metagenome]|uniref:Uncharacterized protein n=1 Tax=marine sediment metagenome TaxID=412755 RepID=X1EBG6_9ZZZZ
MFKALWSGERNKVVDSWKKDIVDLVKKLGLDYVPVFLVPSKKKRIQKPKFINKYTWVDEEGNIWGFNKGRVMCRNCRSLFAPSILAAS